MIYRDGCEKIGGGKYSHTSQEVYDAESHHILITPTPDFSGDFKKDLVFRGHQRPLTSWWWPSYIS